MLRAKTLVDDLSANGGQSKRKNSDSQLFMFDKLIENKIREAMEAGEFDNLPGKGQPLDLDAYFSTPSDLRLTYSVLKSARCVPEEIELRKEVESLTEQLSQCANERQRQSIQGQIRSKTLKLNLLTDSNRRQRGKKA